MISTVYAKVGDQQFDTGLHTTTPGSFLVQKLLKLAFDHGDEFFVLETTSHALDQYRVFGIKFEIGVITNITHEHLDYHLTYENYLKTKSKLLLLSRIGVINADDESYESINKILNIKNKNDKLQFKIVTYGIRNKANILWDNKITTSLLGEFNRQNVLAAYTVCRILGINGKKILKAIAGFRPPIGRLELVHDKEFKVIIDFAHTPNAFIQVLPEIRKNYLKNDGRLIHVFGAAGLRDFTKRPLMGEVSGRFSDVVILTEEDYRTEDINKICQQIAHGLETHKFKKVEAEKLNEDSKKLYTIITNREEAIKKAIKIAKKNDVIVTTGKSHEKSLCRGKTEYPWDEKQIVIKLLKKL